MTQRRIAVSGFHISNPVNFRSQHGHEVALTFNDSHDKGQPSCAAGPPTANFESYKIVGSNPERVDSGRAPVEYSCQPIGPATGIQPFLQIHWYLPSEIREEAWPY